MMMNRCLLIAPLLLLSFFLTFSATESFSVTPFVRSSPAIAVGTPSRFFSSPQNEGEDGVVELGDNVMESLETKSQLSAPFLSQGEISEEALNPDLSDPKQARVIFYIILSLIPVLFLVPLILGSRDLIPSDMLPPVEM